MTRIDPSEAAPIIDSNEVTLELLGRIRDGDMDAWESIYSRYCAALTRLATGSLNGEVRRRLDTQDLVQSTFLAAHVALGRFEHRGRGSLHAWLRQILVNRIRQKQREHLCDQRDARRHADSDALLGECDLSMLSPSDAMQAAEEELRYAEALAELPARDQEIIVATQIDGETTASVAERLGENVATVRRRRALAIGVLAKKLD